MDMINSFATCPLSWLLKKQTQTQTQVIRTQAVRPLCPTHIIAIVIMTAGKLGPKHLPIGMYDFYMLQRLTQVLIKDFEEEDSSKRERYTHHSYFNHVQDRE